MLHPGLGEGSWQIMSNIDMIPALKSFKKAVTIPLIGDIWNFYCNIECKRIRSWGRDKRCQWLRYNRTSLELQMRKWKLRDVPPFCPWRVSWCTARGAPVPWVFCTCYVHSSTQEIFFLCSSQSEDCLIYDNYLLCTIHVHSIQSKWKSMLIT